MRTLILPAMAAAAVIFAMEWATADEAIQQPSAPHVVDLRAADGTPLKATYFAAAKPGPGVLLLHQGNRTRKSWDDVATRLAAAGINTLTIDLRMHGESGGTPVDQLSPEQRKTLYSLTEDDADAGFHYLVSQTGVERDVIGIGMAGAFGVVNGVETARRHPGQTKSLVLMSGETNRDGLQFLHEASQLPGLFIVSDEDEYPPTAEAMELLYATSSSPGKKFLHYSASQDAPWLWYETSFSDFDKVPATGNHGTDLFKGHPDLPGMIVDWFVTTLIKTPGHAPADGVAAAVILNQLEWGGSAGVAQVTQQLLEARKKDPKAQLFPEIAVDIVGEDYGRARDFKSAIEIFKLNLLAYPNSVDALDNLADAYLQDGQKDLARPLAEKALAILNEGKLPASSWSNTEQRRGEVRKFTETTLKDLGQKKP
jgi:pimeloyl-ACP methyl ester carboxylesterase